MSSAAVRVRLEAELLGRIDEHRRWIEAQVPGLMLNRSDAIRQLLRQSLAQAEEIRLGGSSERVGSVTGGLAPLSDESEPERQAGAGSSEDPGPLYRSVAELSADTRRFLVDSGRSQAWLAEVLGTSRQQVSRWLSGERPPGKRWTRMLYEVTGVDWSLRRPSEGAREKVDLVRLPEFLRSWRQETGWSQRTLAEQLGTSQRVVSGWENGHAAPQRRNLERLKELGISLPLLGMY